METRQKLRLILACALYAVVSVLEIGTAYFSAKIIECAEMGNGAHMWRMVLVTCVLVVLTYLGIVAATAARLAFVANGTVRMRDEIMGSLFRRPLRSFRGENDAYYLSLLGADVDIYGLEKLNLIPYLFGSAASILSAAVMLWSLNPWLFAIGVLLSVLPLATSKLFTNATQKRKKAVSQTAQEYTGVLKEGIEGYTAIRMGAGQQSFLERFHAVSARRQRAYSASALANTMSMQTLYIMAGLLNIACLGVGGYLALQGQLTIAMLYAASSYSTSLSNSFSNITEYVVTIRSTQKVTEKLFQERDTSLPQGGDLPQDVPPIIEYENVSFAFGERQLYKDFHYHFAPGGCYAVVGESGSGKSTLMKLLLRYYDDYTGVIRLAGHDIREISEDVIYEMVGVVDQSPFLFNASLYENITLFGSAPAKDSEEYRQLLRSLNLTGLAQRVGDAPLGDFGDNISGGERQRINIARAVRKHPKVMVFDEPATGLDPENVALIERFIFGRTDMTRIVITHNWDETYLRGFDGVIPIGRKDSTPEFLR